MRGMNAATGKALEGLEHLAQSIVCILTTMIGTRVERRDFGSLLPALIDQPFNGATRTRLYGATATALIRWEPRIRLSSVSITPAAEAGQFTLAIEGRRTDAPPTSDYTRLTIPLNFR